MLPIATPPNAIVFATMKCEQLDMAKVGLILNLFCIAIIGSMTYFVWVVNVVKTDCTLLAYKK